MDARKRRKKSAARGKGGREESGPPGIQKRDREVPKKSYRENENPRAERVQVFKAIVGLAQDGATWRGSAGRRKSAFARSIISEKWGRRVRMMFRDTDERLLIREKMVGVSIYDVPA